MWKENKKILYIEKLHNDFSNCHGYVVQHMTPLIQELWHLHQEGETKEERKNKDTKKQKGLKTYEKTERDVTRKKKRKVKKKKHK